MNRTKKNAGKVFQPKAVAVAVAVVCSGMAYADGWAPNAEVFVKPGNERSLLGVDALVPLSQDANSLFFADLKAHLETQDANEFNLGLGYRSLLSDSDWALGVYGAWDRRHSRHGNDFDQGTLGLEARSSTMDLRANYYHPFTDKKLLNWSNDIQFSGFGVYRKGYYEEAMRGYDAEVGVLLPISDTVETRVYLAGYSFDGQDVAPRTNGGRIRLEVRPQQNLIFGLSHQHDSLFGSATFAELRYAFGKPSTSGVRKIRDRMTDPWVRDIDVVISPVLLSHRPEDAQALLDPLTGKVMEAVHIDNNRGSDTYSGADIGSYEHPYRTADGCYGGKCETTVGETSVGKYDTIYLWQGNSLSTPYTTTQGRVAVFQLLDGQKLWGEGYNPLTGAVNSARRPVIDGGEGRANGVQLASNGTIGNTVAGVNIQNADRGIIGNNTGGTVTIHDVGMTNVYRGIELTNQVSGTPEMTIAESDSGNFTQTVSIFNTNISASDDAIHLQNSAGDSSTITQTVNIRDNTLTSANGNGINLLNNASGSDNDYYAHGGQISQHVTISGNTITTVNGGNGINLWNEATGATSPGGYGGSVEQTAIISGNQISAYGTGIDVWNQAGKYGGGDITQTATISHNLITATTGDGIYVDNSATGGGTITQGGMATVSVASYGSDVGLTISDNTITAGYHGVHLYNDVNGSGHISQVASLTNNAISAGHDGGEGAALLLENYDNSAVMGTVIQTVTVSGGSISAVYGGAVDITNHASNDGSVTQDVSFDRVAISSTYGSGVSVHNSTADAGIMIAQPSGYYGGSVTQTLSITNSTIDAGGSGVRVLSASGPRGTIDQTLTVSSNTINSAYGQGVLVANSVYASDYNSSSLTQHSTITSNTINVTGNSSGNVGVALTNDASQTRYGYGANIQQTADISNNTIHVPYGSGVVVLNTADNGGHIDQGGIRALRPAGAAPAPDLTISGNTITAYGLGIGVANQAGGYNYYGGSSIGQSAAIDNNTVTTAQGIGIGLGNTAQGSGDGYAASSTQYVTLTGNTVTVSGPGEVVLPEGATVPSLGGVTLNAALAVGNWSEHGASAEQTVMLNDNPRLSAAYGTGVLGGNNASYGGQAIQNVTIDGNGTGVIHGGNYGVHFLNEGYAGNASATQHVAVGVTTVQVDGGEGMVFNNYASDGAASAAATATQNVSLTGNAVQSSNAFTGVTFSNHADKEVSSYGGVVADQTLTMTDNTGVQGGYGVTVGNAAHDFAGGGYGGSTATQTIAGFSGNTVVGAYGGVSFSNNGGVYSAGGSATANQVTSPGAFTGNTINTTNGTALSFNNNAYNGTGSGQATSTQDVAVGAGNTLVSSNGVGVAFTNQADQSSYGGAVASQIGSLASSSVSAYGSGVSISNQVTSSYGGSATQNVSVDSNTVASSSAYALDITQPGLPNTATQTVNATGNTLTSPHTNATHVCNESGGTQNVADPLPSSNSNTGVDTCVPN